MFGRIAAAKSRIHFCFVGEDELRQSDEAITEHIQHERLLWKRRSLQPHPEISNPAHGFILVVTAQRLAFAEPDGNLKTFCERLLSCWEASVSNEPWGTVHSETLFLKDPNEEHAYTRFRFSIDFFMSQGDGRWWQDHRIPGGIAFTANSVGHMRRYREWYEQMASQESWTLQTAMLTIDAAAETPYGKATWLRSLTNGRPMVSDQKCPFEDPSKIKPALQGKDWTRYGGHLHTDHAIRDEFFHPQSEKIADIKRSDYLEDFTYLYDPRQRDHLQFVSGVDISEQEVINEIGKPDEWVKIHGRIAKSPRKDFQTRKNIADVERLLAVIRNWAYRDQAPTNPKS
jgi:hypothetical protein